MSLRRIFGDCELRLASGAILTIPADALVIPATAVLEHASVPAHEIMQQAGETALRERTQLLREYGALENGMALFTGAGSLPYRALIHAIVPGMNEDEPRRILELAVSRSLQMCELNEWRSLVLPSFCGGESNLTTSDCAKALFHAVTRFWDARHDPLLRSVIICVEKECYGVFEAIMREHDGVHKQTEENPRDAGEARTGYVDLSDESSLPDDEIDSWFK